MSIRDYDMALNVVRIWLQSGDFELCYTSQLITTYELDASFFDVLVKLKAIEAHYDQPNIFKSGAALSKISAKNIIDAIQNDSPKTFTMEEQLKQWLAEIIKPIVLEAVREVMEGMEQVPLKPQHVVYMPPKEIEPKPVIRPKSEYMDKKQAAEFLGISVATLSTYNKRIPRTKNGNKTYYHYSDLSAYKNSTKSRHKTNQ